MQAELGALSVFYGPLAAPPRDLFAFFVWEVISARTLPARRDIAWQALRRLPALTPDAMFRATKEELKAAIEGLGGFDERLEALKAGSGHFKRHRELPERVSGPLLGAMRALRDVPHLTPGGRLRALLYAGGHAVAPADDAIARVVGRLHGRSGGPGAASRRFARRTLTAAIGHDRDAQGQALLLLGHHATRACVEHAPHCGVCPLRDRCAFGRDRTPQPSVG